MQFYAYGSLFTPQYPDYMTEGGEGRVDHEGLQTRRHTHSSADCSPHTRRIAGGGADSRISELSDARYAIRSSYGRKSRPSCHSGNIQS